MKKFEYLQVEYSHYPSPEELNEEGANGWEFVMIDKFTKQFWTCDWFSFHDTKQVYPFACVGHYVSQCIPYESNEHLLGTTDDCDEFYKNW